MSDDYETIIKNCDVVTIAEIRNCVRVLHPKICESHMSLHWRWNPIETAREFKEVLISDGVGVWIGSLYCDHGIFFLEDENGGQKLSDTNAKSWMPIPSPPSVTCE